MKDFKVTSHEINGNDILVTVQPDKGVHDTDVISKAQFETWLCEGKDTYPATISTYHQNEQVDRTINVPVCQFWDETPACIHDALGQFIKSNPEIMQKVEMGLQLMTLLSLTRDFIPDSTKREQMREAILEYGSISRKWGMENVYATFNMNATPQTDHKNAA